MEAAYLPSTPSVPTTLEDYREELTSARDIASERRKPKPDISLIMTGRQRIFDSGLVTGCWSTSHILPSAKILVHLQPRHFLC